LHWVGVKAVLGAHAHERATSKWGGTRQGVCGLTLGCYNENAGASPLAGDVATLGEFADVAAEVNGVGTC